MALYKSIRQPDGVTTNYHRILGIMQTVNRQTSIIVLSYVDEESRSDERISAETQPYQKSVTYEKDYDPNLSVEDAYSWLKTLPVFEGAENV